MATGVLTVRTIAIAVTAILAIGLTENASVGVVSVATDVNFVSTFHI